MSSGAVVGDTGCGTGLVAFFNFATAISGRFNPNGDGLLGGSNGQAIQDPSLVYTSPWTMELRDITVAASSSYTMTCDAYYGAYFL